MIAALLSALTLRGIKDAQRAGAGWAGYAAFAAIVVAVVVARYSFYVVF